VLALRTIERRPAALDDAPDRSTLWAWPSFAVVYREAFGEVAELSARRSEIAKGRPAGGDRFGKNFVDREDKPFEARWRDASPSARRMNAGSVERFAYINIAEAGHDALIEEQQLDRCASAGELLFEVASV
jgi:hypothetical protein